MKKLRVFLCMGLLLLLSFCFIGCDWITGDSSPSSPSSTEKKVTVDSSSIVFTSEELYGGHYSVSIKGIARNNTNKILSYVSLDFSLFDSDGNSIGTAIDTISNLSAGGTWKFDATSVVNFYPARCRLSNISAF